MAKVKVSEATELQLDWMVATCEGLAPQLRHEHMKAKALAHDYRGDLAWHLEQQINDPITVTIDGVTKPIPAYSTDPSRSWPIIEREKFSIWFEAKCPWYSVPAGPAWGAGREDTFRMGGPTALIAGMRCFCVSKLGEEVEVPDELV